ncbi:hypothetical protein SPRG_19228 [Saprolegnia parasitica CBS 223.65]|uniref:PX domain-containing protein n=1 Tax=Saprolegnia parasitica (strain CBS 223.65) TaxID=695850 RepID=A0A067CSV4_SAPPC|nr:hypothetical protein SPRG_19228 [Saprolegnia parasitica CBS 223.65]KDO33598.1 hypothetical protein SPRG_19228 [Saprolegnia parasitica CBS 223.65]|eukprot:XP_012195648.1 hypothetical protein SPRG_19228 [Saprolegnia parasitica CBS 223.65]
MGVLLHKMKGILASVTSCIGGTQERYVVCVKSSERGLWYVYKLHADFVALYETLLALAASSSCAQECWLAPLLIGLKASLDPTAGEKLSSLNSFLHKLMAVQSAEAHADVCLLRPKIDAQLKTFLEWKHDCSVGVKRAAGSECIVLQPPPGALRRTTFSIIQSKVVVPTPSHPGSPLKARRLHDLDCRDAPARRRVYTEVNFDGL